MSAYILRPYTLKKVQKYYVFAKKNIAQANFDAPKIGYPCRTLER